MLRLGEGKKIKKIKPFQCAVNKNREMRRREAAVKPGSPFTSKSFTGHNVIKEFRIHVIIGFLEV